MTRGVAVPRRPWVGCLLMATASIGFSSDGNPCGSTHPRCRIPDAIVLELRDRVEVRHEACEAVRLDLERRGHVVPASYARHLLAYRRRSTVATRWIPESPVRAARRRLQLRLVDLAASAGIGLRTLIRVELDKVTPRPGTLQRLASALGVDAGTLVRGGCRG